MNTISYRHTWAEIDLDAIYHNTQVFKKHLSHQTKLMTVVKADGYGHGAYEVAQSAIEAGADYLGVAFLDEALDLRQKGIQGPILVLGYTPPESVQEAVKNDIALTVCSEDVIDRIIEVTERHQKSATVHLKIDTGMGRLGVRSREDALHQSQKLSSSSFIFLEGVFTHFANADTQDPTLTKEQFQKFNVIVDHLLNHGIHISIKHCCNSAGTINYPDMHLDMVRVGISLYGLQPSHEVDISCLGLKQAMHFKTKLSALKEVEPGEGISYGYTFHTEKTTSIGTIPVGYADGFSRLLSNKGDVLIRGIRVPIIGNICMDQSMIDLTGLENVHIGEEVTLFGRDNQAFLSVAEFAGFMGKVNYEVVCLIGKRVPRVYIKNQEIRAYRNCLVETC
ncbi:alanine racemase [Texcoconibacillus texcoconensis]|uniref:Alanine racemase n=1 Tax=Texcoconibacillus texcoconensis TaxID=1095777 RepID=A0A840QMK1_9BACI|nr:alanine racemase [Texcoconibacillus texcoconensis]MBB5172588.1 alanine racemase [Texcoconibacillus texcoconensis]